MVPCYSSCDSCLALLAQVLQGFTTGLFWEKQQAGGAAGDLQLLALVPQRRRRRLVGLPQLTLGVCQLVFDLDEVTDIRLESLQTTDALWAPT